MLQSCRAGRDLEDMQNLILDTMDGLGDDSHPHNPLELHSLLDSMTKDVFDMDVVDGHRDDQYYNHDESEMMMDYYEVKVSKNKRKNGRQPGSKNSRKQSKAQTSDSTGSED
jgi:hypothetical protein